MNRPSLAFALAVALGCGGAPLLTPVPPVTSAIAVHTTRKRLLGLPRIAPLLVQHATTSADAVTAAAPRDLDARVAVDGRRATIELASFALPLRSVPEPVRAGVEHWSQWIDGWCIDWDHRGGAMVTLATGSRVWRSRAQAGLPLSATHAYDGPGRYVALVKAFDVLGGEATKRLEVEVA